MNYLIYPCVKVPSIEKRLLYIPWDTMKRIFLSLLRLSHVKLKRQEMLEKYWVYRLPHLLII